MPTLKVSLLRQRFRKSVEYLWRCRIFAGTVYRLKVAKFQMLSMRKVFTFHCKSKIAARLNLYAQMPTLNIVELRQRFRKSVEYLWRYRIFAGTVYRLKVGNFKCCRCAKFSPCHCKSKIPGQGENLAHVQHLKFPTFNLYTVTAKILYLQRYSTDFRNLCLSSTMLRVGIWV